MSLNKTLLDLSEPQSDYNDRVGSDGITMVEEQDTGGGGGDFEHPSSLAEYRASEMEAQQGGGGGAMRPSLAEAEAMKGRRGGGKLGFRGRWAWAADASDEMIFHWLCTSKFNERCADPGYAHSTCIVRWNPLYWMAFLVTVLSLFAGREFHICLDQGDKVNPRETRQEYEVRVHWVYCTSGAMLWVLARSLMTLIYDAIYRGAYPHADDDEHEWNLEAQVVCWLVVAFFCAGNAVFLRMMRLQHLAGVRCIIICNFVFTVCMFGSLIYYVAECVEMNDSDDDKLDDRESQADATKQQCRTDGDLESEGRMAFVIFEKFSAVVFFIIATIIYARLWSEYKYDGRDLKRRLCETIPAIIAALAMLVLMFCALVGKQEELQPYVWATFTRRLRLR